MNEFDPKVLPCSFQQLVIPKYGFIPFAGVLHTGLISKNF